MLEETKQRIRERAQSTAPKRISEWAESFLSDTKFWGLVSCNQRMIIATQACRALIEEGFFAEDTADLTLKIVSDKETISAHQDIVNNSFGVKCADG